MASAQRPVHLPCPSFPSPPRSIFLPRPLGLISPHPPDFRKDYTRLSFFKQRFPSVPLLALTATATQRVRVEGSGGRQPGWQPGPQGGLQGMQRMQGSCKPGGEAGGLVGRAIRQSSIACCCMPPPCCCMYASLSGTHSSTDAQGAAQYQSLKPYPGRPPACLSVLSTSRCCCSSHVCVPPPARWLQVQHDVVAQLGIQHCLMFKSSFNRPNLRRVRCAVVVTVLQLCHFAVPWRYLPCAVVVML